MRGIQNRKIEEAVASYAHWWREAGLHTATDTLPQDWRQPATPFWQRASAPRQQVQRPVAQAEAPRPRNIESARPAAMPASLPAFLAWLGSDATQPESGWQGPAILPPEAANPRLLVILDMPGIGARDAASLIETGQRRLLDAMLASIGLAPADAAVSALAIRRPPGGLLDEDLAARLGSRMNHYLGLVRPGAVLLMGDRTSRALIGVHWSPGGESLHSVNHAGGSMPAVSLAHPDLLMARPGAKAKSWQTLRLLHGILNA